MALGTRSYPCGQAYPSTSKKPCRHLTFKTVTEAILLLILLLRQSQNTSAGATFRALSGCEAHQMAFYVAICPRIVCGKSTVGCSRLFENCMDQSNLPRSILLPILLNNSGTSPIVREIPIPRALTEFNSPTGAWCKKRLTRHPPYRFINNLHVENLSNEHQSR